MEALAAIAQPCRRRILQMVWADEMCAGDIAAQFDVTFGAVSQHLGALRKSGLVDVRSEGRRRFYRARKEPLGPLAGYLEALWQGQLDQLKALAEHEEAGR